MAEGDPTLSGLGFSEKRANESDESYRYRQQEGGSGAMAEIMRRTYNADLLGFALRQSITGQEDLIAQGQEPDQWSFRIARDTLDGRLNALSLEQYPELVAQLELVNYGMGGNGKSKDKDGNEKIEPINRERVIGLMRVAREAKDELFARWTVLEALSKQVKLSSDVGEYAKMFIANWATWPEARHYGIIGRLPPTPFIPERKEGKEVVSFGTLVDEGLRGWVSIAEQKPIRKGEELDENMPPNIFALETYQDQIDLGMEWVIKQLERKSGYEWPAGISEEEKKASLGYRDLMGAANLAYIIFRQLDMDVRYCFREKDSEAASKAGNITDMLAQASEAVDLYKLEIGPLGKDSAKLNWWVLRSLGEAAREYPASIGLPLLVGKFPNLSTDFMRMIGVTRRTDVESEIAHFEKKEGKEFSEERKEEIRAERKNDEQSLSLYELWRDHEVEFGNLPWDVLNWEEGKEVFSKALGIKDANGRNRLWNVEGIGKQSFKIPYFLEIFYAYSKIYSVITEANVSETAKLLGNPGELRKLNKAWQLVFSFIGGRCLSKGTSRRVMQLSKCNLIGAYLVARSNYGRIEPLPIDKREVLHEGPTVPYDKTINVDIKTAARDEQVRIGRQAGFLTLKEKEKFKDDEGLTKKELAELEETTIRLIIDQRKALLPHEAAKIRTKSGKSWFSEEELTAIKESDLYTPF